MKKIKAGQVELMPNSGVYIPELLYKSVKASRFPFLYFLLNTSLN